MKNIFKLTIVAFLLFCIKANAQLDTLNYLKQFEANKSNYIGFPLSKLLNDMTQIQPKTVWSLPIRNKKSMVRYTDFSFCEKPYSFHNAITLSIEWQTNIPINQTNPLGTQNQHYFTNDEKGFYGSKIIKDILVYR